MSGRSVPAEGPPVFDDVGLLAAAAQGRPAAVRRLLDEVAPVVYGFIFARVGGDEAAAEDLLQDTLLEAVRSARTYRGDAALSTWLCAIARRRLARHYEAERRADAARAGLRLVMETRPAPAGEHPVDTRDEIVRALGQLPASQRQALVLKYLDDLSVDQIAAVTGQSAVQVQSILQRGRDGLRRRLGGDDA